MIEYIRNKNLNELSTFRIGGPADRFIEPESVEMLIDVIGDLKAHSERFLVIGNGSNLLFSDEGYRGTIVKVGKGLDKVECCSQFVTAGSGALLSSVAKNAAKCGLTGLEFACGIPGSIGGGVFMNAGAYDGQLSDCIHEVYSISPSGEKICRAASACDFSYRHSVYMENEEIIFAVNFFLENGKVEAIEEKISELTEKRVSKQPLQYPSAGSFFKRPEGYFAGKLIEDAGLKGFSVGGAQVSEQHAGFVINKGGATYQNVIDLMHYVQDKVFEQFGVKLEPEVRIIGS